VSRRRLLFAGAALFAAAASGGAGAVEKRLPYLQRDDVLAFIRDAAAAYELDPAWIERWLRVARYSPRAEQLMQPPPPPAQRNWHDYRARTLEPRRIGEGRAFLQQHRAALERATQRYGVPPEYVVAILGVETFYGRFKGTFATLDVLVTLSFDYTRRAELFRRELGEFLRLCRDQQLDPRLVQGSYAGAIGFPQFLPSSIRRHAVDFDGDGRVDLVGSAVDAIGSVAAFLADHGWQREQPLVLLDARAAEGDESAVEELGGGITPNVQWRELAWRGMEIDGTLELDTPVLLVDLPVAEADGARGQLLRVATANFCAILHYNRSYFYAASVHALAKEIAGTGPAVSATEAVRRAPESAPAPTEPIPATPIEPVPPPTMPDPPPPPPAVPDPPAPTPPEPVPPPPAPPN
jgi:membrane-bound lytic murein transglycosylase B